MLSAEKIRQIDAYYEARDSFLARVFGCYWFVPSVESVFPDGETYAEYHRLKRMEREAELAENNRVLGEVIAALQNIILVLEGGPREKCTCSLPP